MCELPGKRWMGKLQAKKSATKAGEEKTDKSSCKMT